MKIPRIKEKHTYLTYLHLVMNYFKLLLQCIVEYVVLPCRLFALA